MEIKTENVTLRQLIPAEGKAIKNTVTEEYYPEGLYLAKEADENDFIEVDLSEVPQPEDVEVDE